MLPHPLNLGGRLIGVSLSVLLGWLAFPPMGWWPLAPIAWLPWLYAIHGAPLRLAGRLSLLFGVTLYGSVLSWLGLVFGITALALWLILALFIAVFGTVYAWLCQEYGECRHRLVLFTACLWTGLEWYRCEAFVLSFSWVTPGVGLGPCALSPWFGVYGVSFVIMLGVACCVHRQMLLGGCLFVACWLMVLLFAAPADSEKNPLSVRLVQCEQGALSDYINLSLTTPQPPRSPDLVIWPEYALPYLFDLADARNAPLTRFLEKQAATTTLILGTMTETPEGWQNTAITLGAGGTLGSHGKRHTVHLFDDGIPGKSSLPVRTPNGLIGTPICFDVDHNDVTRAMTIAGAVAFAVPSMDASHWSARQHEQHAMQFRLRAAENARYFAVAATSGVTQIVDHRGRVKASLPLMEPGHLDGVIERRYHQTFYTRFGWRFGPACAIGGLIIVAATLCRRRFRPLAGG